MYNIHRMKYGLAKLRGFFAEIPQSGKLPGNQTVCHVIQIQVYKDSMPQSARGRRIAKHDFMPIIKHNIGDIV